ncbi:MAG: hypothetical protein ACLQIQ_08510 [Beijerinckiaceae bacterium]
MTTPTLTLVLNQTEVTYLCMACAVALHVGEGQVTTAEQDPKSTPTSIAETKANFGVYRAAIEDLVQRLENAEFK